MVDVKRNEYVVEKDSIIQCLQEDVNDLRLIFVHWIYICYTYCRSELEIKKKVIDELLKETENIVYPLSADKGKPLDEVEERQHRRKLMSLKEASKKAPWFLDSFHIDIQSIIVKTRRKHEVITLDYSSTAISLSSHHSNQLIDENLYLFDVFNICDEFYHHLSMIHPQLLRSYNYSEGQRDDISSNVAILHLPKPYFGCYRYIWAFNEKGQLHYILYNIDVQV